jgi:GNAT superfamily N-acetyltransferase
MVGRRGLIVSPFTDLSFRTRHLAVARTRYALRMADPSAARITITAHDDPPAADAAILDGGLGAANEAAAPMHEVRALACFARGAAGAVIGGAIGRTWGECAELRQLWVEPAHRRRGLATQLVRCFEQRARSRGCRRCYLDTFSFMAPQLYRGLGYAALMQIDGFAPGITKYTMLREIGSDTDTG